MAVSTIYTHFHFKANRLRDLQNITKDKPIPQVQSRFIQYVCRVAGVIVALAFHQNAAPMIFDAH